MKKMIWNPQEHASNRIFIYRTIIYASLQIRDNAPTPLYLSEYHKRHRRYFVIAYTSIVAPSASAPFTFFPVFLIFSSMVS